MIAIACNAPTKPPQPQRVHGDVSACMVMSGLIGVLPSTYADRSCHAHEARTNRPVLGAGCVLNMSFYFLHLCKVF